MLGGLELGGVPLATLLGQRTGLPVVFVREQAKDYGTKRLAEGDDPAGRHVVLIEDVITTGGAVRSAATTRRALGATVDTVVCVIDREHPDGNLLAGSGIHSHAVLTRSLLDSA